MFVPTILCIDDHPPTLQTLRWLFEANGYTCLTATSAKEGRRLFEENQVDLVVVDHLKDSSEGSPLAAVLKRMRPVPVLMLSGWAELDKPEGVDVLLIKPQEPKALLSAVLNLIVKTQTSAV